MEEQYKKEKEEVNGLLLQQKLVRMYILISLNVLCVIR